MKMANGKLSLIPADFGEVYLPYVPCLRQRQKARAFSRGSYICNLKIFANKDRTVDIRSGVFRSQRKNDKPHSISLRINADVRKIEDALCSCKAGVSGQCAHVLAVIMTVTDWILEGLKEVPAQPACTSLPQQWDKPRGQKILPEPVSSMVIAKPGNLKRKRKPLTAVFDDNRESTSIDSAVSALQDLSGCSLSYLAYTPDQFVQTDRGLQAVGSALAYHIPLMNDTSINCPNTTCGDLELSPKM